MKTLSLSEAAAFLKMHPEEVRRRTKMGRIPGAKAGRAWVFIDDDLAAFLRSMYGKTMQSLRVNLGESISCQFENVATSGGSTSSHQTANEYAELLRPTTKPKRKNSTTS